MIDMKKLFAVLFAALVVVFSAVPALAAKKGNPSPTPSIEYNLIIHKTEGGTGTYTYDKDEDGKHCYIVAKPKKGYRFVKWVIKGKYILEENPAPQRLRRLALFRERGRAHSAYHKARKLQPEPDFAKDRQHGSVFPVRSVRCNCGNHRRARL